MESSETRGSFTGRLGFIMAAAGSAIGLGNIWRFPYLADKYGGGAFLVTFIILALAVGLTLMITELAIGRYTGKSCIDAFQELSAKYRVIGWLGLITPAIIVPYYCVIGGWVTKYFVEYTVGNGSAAGADGGAFFNDFISGSLPGLFDNPMVWFLVFAAVTVAAVMMGVEKGVEMVSKILMPALIVILIVICIYILTLDNIASGLEHYLVPQPEDFSIKTVLGAIGQVFFSLSLASGTLITYGSYMKKDVHIPNSTKVVTLMSILTSFLAGLMIIPATVAFGMDTGEGGPGLMFVIMPQVFDAMPAGHIVAIAFFLLVIFAAVTSAISLTETVVSTLKDRFKMTRITASAACTVLIVALGTLVCLGFGALSGFTPFGRDVLSLFDNMSDDILMPFFALITCILVGHVFNTKAIIDEIGFCESKHGLCYADIYSFMIRYICPVCLFAVFVLGIVTTFGIFEI